MISPPPKHLSTNTFKPCLLWLLLVALLPTTVHAQGTWTRKADYPSYVDGAYGFELNGYGYAGCGRTFTNPPPSYSNSSASAKYDPNTNTWTNVPGNSGFPYSSYSLGFNVNGVGYVLNNYTGSQPYISKYNGTWSGPAPTWTGTSRRDAAGFAIGNKIYYVGGAAISGGSALNDCWAYDVNTNVWSQKANIPSVGRTAAQGFALNGQGYIAGGFTQLETWQYDTTTNGWTQKANMPVSIQQSQSFVINNKAYLVDPNNLASGRDFYQYNPIYDKWTEKAYMPSPYNRAFSFAINGKGYFGGGDSAGDYGHSFWQYTPEIFNQYLSGTVFCAGSTFNVQYGCNYASNTGNIYSIQLSDSSGSFASPTVIGTLAATAQNGFISVTIPSATTYGMHYRVRLTATAPVNYSDPSGYFQIGNGFVPTVSIETDPPGSVCPGTNVDVYLQRTYAGSSPTFQWTVNGVQVSSSSGFSSTTLRNNDTVRVAMTSSLTCAAVPTVKDSFIISMLPYATSTINQSICPGQSYLGHTATGIYVDTFYAAGSNGCDSLRILNLTVANSVSTINQSICAGQSYLGHNSTGTFIDTLHNASANGCDSIRTLNLTVNNATTASVAASICPGSSYNFYGHILTSAGTYYDTLVNTNGCDSIVTLTLSQNSYSTGSTNASICVGTSYAFNGQQLAVAGVYYDTVAGSNCDSIIALTLTVLQPARSTINQSICAGQSYLGHNTTGTFTDTLHSAAANGCDSIRTLNLTVNNASTASVSASICPGSSYNFYGHILTSAGTYRDTLVNAHGCDSIVTLTLSQNNYSTGSTSASICSGNSYAFNGQQLTVAGVYYDTVAGSNCDSIIALTLTVLQPARSTISQSICAGQSYLGHSTTGTFTDTLHNAAANGCDSIRTLNLTVQSVITTSLTTTICNGGNYAGHTNTGTYVDTFPSSGGCDSLRTLNLTVLPVYRDTLTHTICQGDSYHGQTTTGIYTDSLLTIEGCDSITVLNLTVNPLPATPIITEQGGTLVSTAATAYQWYRDTVLLNVTSQTLPLTQNGSYTVVVTDSNGCSNSSAGYSAMNVGIYETSLTQSINLYPNPSNGLFTLALSQPSKQLKIELLSMQGAVLYAEQLTNQPALQKVMDYTELAKGMYLLKVSTEYGVGVRCLMIK